MDARIKVMRPNGGVAVIPASEVKRGDKICDKDGYPLRKGKGKANVHR